MANNAAVFFLEADVQRLAGSLNKSKVVLTTLLRKSSNPFLGELSFAPMVFCHLPA